MSRVKKKDFRKNEKKNYVLALPQNKHSNSQGCKLPVLKATKNALHEYAMMQLWGP